MDIYKNLDRTSAFVFWTTTFMVVGLLGISAHTAFFA